jgi:cobalt-zinc-cadmium efflux system outer membrane protein
VSFSLPWSDRNQGRIARAHSQVALATWQQQEALAALRAELDTARRELEKHQRIARSVAEGQLGIARRVRDRVSEEYEAGKRSLVDVLDALRTYREIYERFIHSRCDFGGRPTS